ncbi:MAG TPA: ABC transporter substrate-binding protein [Stellaceae bacterium]|nr:ABC transporter substrate-binding protein [Stellaceae bacterium]
MKVLALAAALAAALSFAVPRPAAAETVKIGVTKIANSAALGIALERHYFEAEGLTPELTYFDSQQPIAVAVGSGSLDIGIAAITAALFNLAAQDRLRIIAGGIAEHPSFHYLAYVASNAAYAGGLTRVGDLGGHSYALTQMGTGLQWTLALTAELKGFDVKTVRLLPLQSNANIASAIAGGRADSAVFQATGALPLIDRGDAKLLGWVGDETGGYLANLAFASQKAVTGQPDMVARFLKAYRKGAHDYYDAFTGPDGKRRDGPTAPAIVALIAQYLGQPEAMVRAGIPYIDADLRIDVPDVERQMAWYRGEGQMKTDAKLEPLMDRRFVKVMPPAP